MSLAIHLFGGVGSNTPFVGVWVASSSVGGSGGESVGDLGQWDRRSKQAKRRPGVNRWETEQSEIWFLEYFVYCGL